MNINTTTNKELIKFFITNPKLWDLTGYVGESDSFEPNMNYIWLVANEDNKDKILLELRKFNMITYDAHIYTLPEYFGTGTALKAVKSTIKWLKENKPEIKKLILTVPIACEHVFKFLQKTEFKVCGCLKNGIIYKQQLQDLILFEVSL